MFWVKKLSSLKLTLVGMSLMVLAAIAVYGDPNAVSIWVLVIPMALLAINLSAAIISNQKINRQPGLLLFHVSLLALLILAGAGRLIHLDAQMEIRINEPFSADLLQDVSAGPLHGGNLDAINFVQGPYTVQYAKGLRRGLTHSYVSVYQHGAWEKRVVGDDRPLLIDEYRMYTTFNKGFSAIMTWQPNDGKATTGAINMPSYPLFEYKQDNSWTPPGSEPIRLWLRLTTGMDEKAAWTLDALNSKGVLVVNDGDQRVELQPGQEVLLKGGSLRYDRLSAWMGYRVFYDPTIQWLFFISVIGVAGLAQYFWSKLNLKVWESSEEDFKTDGEQAEPTDLSPSKKSAYVSIGNTRG